MGHLELLLVENFKSWRGRQVIGPFRRFTCIIGPNGSGKSNVMDALSFVMGEKTANLRVKNIQELIHGAHIGKPISSSASVKIVYVEESGEEKTFTRIIRGGCSEFHFDDSLVSRSVYMAELEKIGIIAKGQNCLVFQGTVESISLKKPKERTQFFEEISTSGELIGEYEEKKRKLQKADEDAQFNFNKKKNVAAERRHAKLEKEELIGKIFLILQTVALDGTLFLKSGVISGGSSDLKYKARCWDEKELKNLRDRQSQKIQELKDLMKTLRKETDLKQIQTLVQGTQTRLKYSQNELEMIKKKHLVAFYREQSQLQSELLNIESQCTMLSEGIKERQRRIKEFQEKIDKVEDDIFQHFCEEIGVENIREFENKRVKQQQEIDQKRLEFEKQKTRLNIQLEYSRNQLKKKLNKMNTLKETIQKGSEDIDHLKKAEENCLQIVNELMAKQQQLKDIRITQNSNAEKVQTQIEEERKKFLAVDREVGKLQKEVVITQTSLEQKRLEKHNLLLDCKVQDIEIILLFGSLDDIIEVEMGTEAESTQATIDIYEKEEAFEVDYSSLNEDLKALQSDQEIEAHLRLLLQQVASQEDILLKTAAPNLRALENLKTVRDKFQESTDAFEASRKEARMCRQEFEQVKKRRYDLFTQCFEHVSVSIDQIYKKLCRNNSAQAFLSPENPEEPYLEGISYNCVAPGKRFMPMDNLSGGEKCVAALALLFAVHSEMCFYFFQVSSYIKEQTQDQFQMIVISLKEEFYSRADALIGIYPEYDDCMFSRILTLDLLQYPDTEGQESNKRHGESR
ncbi:hypothetical protein H8959_007245 [Pygathrix nigripes]